MRRGFSIHIGLNHIDAKHYGTEGRLPYCENDAHAMKKLALSEGYRVQSFLLNEEATSTNILAELAKAAAKMTYGDILLMTYSGHGSFFPDMNEEEEDRYDETWVLYDRMLLDDELYFAWSKFKPGVRILLISDSCHSGTVTKPLVMYESNRQLDRPDKSSMIEILKEEALLLYKSHKGQYDRHLKFVPSPAAIEIAASVILLSGCGDKQQSISIARSGRRLSLFTDELLTVYHKKGIVYTYSTFLDAIKRRIPKRLRQVPNYYTTGVIDKKFIKQPPFFIG